MMMNAGAMHETLKEVGRERINQNGKWGEQNHGPFVWLAILGEEVGEANKAAIEQWALAQRNKIPFDIVALREYREELIQVAAVAVAMVECLDRGKWKPKGRGEG